MELARPYFLWALVAVVPFVIWRWRTLRATAVPFAPLQYRAARTGTVLLGWSLALEAMILTSAVVGMAGPHRLDAVDTISSEGVDVVLVLDVSASMQAADFEPNRLEALKRVAHDFLGRSAGNRIGVLAFAGHVFTQSPLTTDHAILSELIDGLAYESVSHSDSGGTNIGDALLVATDSLVMSRIEGRDQVVILISDGESNSGIDPILAARHLNEQGVRLHVIGIGGDEPVEVWVNGEPFINTDDEVLTTALDDEQLKDVAAAADGNYQRALDDGVLARIFSELARLESTPLEVRREHVRRWWTLRVAGLCFVLFFIWTGLSGFVLRRPLR